MAQTKTISTLNEKGTQGKLAAVVGVSPQAISKMAKRVNFPRGGTVGQWVQIYCDALRSQAARTGGESNASLADQRARESEQKTLSLQIENQRKLGELAPVDEMLSVFMEFSTAIPSVLQNASEHVIHGIEAKHGITVDDELVAGPLRAAQGSLADTARQLGQRIRRDSDSADAEGAGIDGSLVSEESAAAA